MADFFVLAFLGHLVGDFVLQSKHQALHKGDKTIKGFIICSVHVFIYTVAVCMFLWTSSWLVILLVFIPHWIIDRFSLANMWLKMIGGRTFVSAYESEDKYREFDVAFTSIVYTVTDMTLHLVSLWLVIKFVIL